MTQETLLIQRGSSRSEIDINGAYVKSIVLGGEEILKPSSDGIDTHGGMAMLLPYANRVRLARYVWNGKEYVLPKNNGKHSIHGLTREMQWNVAHRGSDSLTLSLKLDTECYPVPLFLKVTYTISDRAFSVSIEAHNEGDIPAPFMAGMHPYFKYDGEWKIECDRSLLRLNYEDSYFPDGSISPVDPVSLNSKSSLKYDNSFIAGDEVRLNAGKHKLNLHNRGMPFMVVYNGEYAEGKSVAVEPMSGAPDAFNNDIGLVAIKAKSSFTCSSVFELTE